jgi:hypothetical protein
LASFGLDLSGLSSVDLTRTWNLQRNYNWQLLMVHNFGGTIRYLVSQLCQDISFSDYSISEISTLKSGAFQRFYAGLQSIEQVVMEFLVPVDNSVQDYFYAWYENMIDRDGYYYPKANYKRNVYIILYDQMKVKSGQFILKGCFPKSHPIIHPSYTDEKIMQAQVIMSVDKVETSGGLLGMIRSGIFSALGNIRIGGI